MFTGQQMKWLLDNVDALCPVCIPSYKRFDRKENKTLTRIIEGCDREIQDNTYVFVRKEQASAYRDSFPSVNIVVLPEVNGLAGTRQYICDFVASDLSKPHFMDMDDDITGLKTVSLNEHGKPCLSKAGEADQGKIIRLGYAISKVAFGLHKCVLGNMRRVRFANELVNTQTAYVTNKGATPRQVMYISVKALREKHIRRNMMFDPTGDDVGFVAEIAKTSSNFFNIPCLAYSFVDDAVNSVIRNDSNRKELAQYEYRCLKKYPMADYLRIPFTFEDGTYKFSDIDYTKYRKITGLKSESVTLERFYEVQRRKVEA